MTSSSLIDPVVDHLADLVLWEAELAADPAPADPLWLVSPLVARLAQVPDPRRLRHPLLVILVLTACATLMVGNDGVTAIRQWAARTPQDVLHRLGARRNPVTGKCSDSAATPAASTVSAPARNRVRHRPAQNRCRSPSRGHFP